MVAKINIVQILLEEKQWKDFKVDKEGFEPSVFPLQTECFSIKLQAQR